MRSLWLLVLCACLLLISVRAEDGSGDGSGPVSGSDPGGGSDDDGDGDGSGSGSDDDDDESSGGSSDEDRRFWDTADLVEDDFRRACEESGGVFDDDDDGTDFSCEYATRASCLANGGSWVPVVHKDKAQDSDEAGKDAFDFECFLAANWDDFDDSAYDEAQAWAPPLVEFSAEGVKLEPGVWSLPLEVNMYCADGAEIVFTYAHNLDASCDESCMDEPTVPAVRDGDAQRVPSGKQFSLNQAGRHTIVMRTVGLGRFRSEVVSFDIKTVRTEIAPPDDTDLAYVRSHVVFAVADVIMFDVFSFRTALRDVLNTDLGTSILLSNVKVLGVDADGVEFEIRLTAAEEAVVVPRLQDPLFLYPLAALLWEFGLLNATDSCSAAGAVTVDGDGFTTLRGLITSSTPVALLAGLAGGFVVVVLGAGLLYRRMVRRVRKRERDVGVKAKAVDDQESDLNKREKELSDSLDQLKKQQGELLTEKGSLDEEKDALEVEAEQAREEVAELEKEELRSIDPEAAEVILQEERLEAKSAAGLFEQHLDALTKTFADAIGEDEILKDTAEMKRAIVDSELALVVKPSPRRDQPDGGAAAAGSDVAKLKRYAEDLPPAQKRAYDGLIDTLVAKGALKDVADDPKERVKQEYREALRALKTDMYSTKQMHAERFADRRKARLSLVIHDAKVTTPRPDAEASGGGDAEAGPETKGSLEAEIDAELQKRFEADAEAIKAAMPNQDDYEKAMAKLADEKAAKRKEQLEALQKRREKTRQRLKESQAKVELQRQKAEQRQLEIAAKVSNVFKKISSVDNKVKKLKEDHQQAQTQLEDQIRTEKERQRAKLAARKTKAKTGAKTSKVAPAAE